MNVQAAIAIYRLPQESEVTKVVGPLSSFDPLNSDESFVIAPFDFPNRQGYMIKPTSVERVNKLEDFPKVSIQSQPSESPADRFKVTVSRAIGHIGQSPLEKVVLSRIKPTPFSSIQLNELFFDLSDAYPDAFVYILNHPDIGTWVGASPELLLKSGNGEFETVSLAGTIKTEDLQSGKTWGPKELTEQNYVTQYIVDSLKNLNVREVSVSDLFTKENGPVCHLCNSISFSSNHNTWAILDALHPTPAVCGIPLDEAGAFITKNETHDREFYTGFLGPNHLNNKTLFFVNLRCMKVYKGLAHYFVGAGITAESNAESEWTETENKARVLASVIEKIGT